MDFKNKDLDDLIKQDYRGGFRGNRGGFRGRGTPVGARGGAQRALNVARQQKKTGIFKRDRSQGQRQQTPG